MRVLIAVLCLIILAACTLDVPNPEGLATDAPSGGGSNNTAAPTGGSNNNEGTLAQVNFVVDGDTIDVEIGGQSYRVRYIGMNTPEREEECYQEAKDANARLVEGQTVRLVFDTSDTDRFDRLLRYVYVGDTFVNAELVREGYAEVVNYPPDDAQFDNFRQLEQAAVGAGLGCHPTGIFDDNTYER